MPLRHFCGTASWKPNPLCIWPTMRSMGGEVTYASGVTTLRKPEPSAMLAAAQGSPAAIAFLKSARFPKAVVEKETEGYLRRNS